MLLDKNRDLHFILKESMGKLSQSNSILPFKIVNLFPIRLFPILNLAVFIKFKVCKFMPCIELLIEKKREPVFAS